MSRRIKGFTVALDSNYREDDVEAIKNAILMVKGVVEVEDSEYTPADWVIRQRVEHEFRERIFKALTSEEK